VNFGFTTAGSGEYAVGDGVTSALLSIRLPLKLTPLDSMAIDLSIL